MKPKAPHRNINPNFKFIVYVCAYIFLLHFIVNFLII